MVSTRSHPSAFPPADLTSPTKRSSRASSAVPAATNALTTTASPTTTTTVTTSSPPSSPTPWTHTPTPLTLAWLALSLPLVLWDTLYLLLRPATLPGGPLHSPFWSPYALYGAVDGVYSAAAWEAGDGFGAAQAVMNAVETGLYGVYLAMVWGRKDLGGRKAGRAVAVAFAASVMTLSKTVLYWAHEAASGWAGVGHNDAVRLVGLWVIPNGLWLIFPTYMIWVFGGEIVRGLEAASEGAAAAASRGKKAQ